MPANGIYVLDKFKGMNRDGYKWNMDSKFQWDLVNMYAQVSEDGRGFLQQRDGLTKFNTTVVNDATTKIRYLTQFRYDDGTTPIIARAGTKWLKFNNTTKVFDDLITGRVDDTKGYSTRYDNVAILVDGGIPQKVTQAGVVSVMSVDPAMPQDATSCHTHQQRVWLNSTAEPMKIFGSKVGLPFAADAYSATSDSITLDLSRFISGGDEVIGFKSFGDQMLVVEMKRNLLIYNAPTVFANIELVQVIPTGTLSQHSVIELADDGAYAGREGIKSFVSSRAFQKFDTKDLSGLIAPYYRELVKNEADPLSITGIYYHRLNHYYLTVHSAGASNTLVYNPNIGNVVGVFRYHANPYSYVEQENGDLLIGMDDGFVYKVDALKNTDDGLAVQVFAEFALLGIDLPTVYKAPREFEMLIETDTDVNMNLEYSFPLEDQDTLDTLNEPFTIKSVGSSWDTATWDSAVWDGPGRRLFRTASLIGRGRLIGLRLSHNTLNSKIRIVYGILHLIMEGIK